MKKTMQILKDNGLFNSVVKSVKNDNTPREGVEALVLMNLLMDKKLKHHFQQETCDLGLDYIWKEVKKAVEEQEATEALKDVDPEALFRKATGQDPEEDPDELDELDEEDAVTTLEDFLDRVINDFEKFMKGEED